MSSGPTMPAPVCPTCKWVRIYTSAGWWCEVCSARTGIFTDGEPAERLPMTMKGRVTEAKDQHCSAGIGVEPLQVYDQCAQIVRSFHGEISEKARDGLVHYIEHFKGLHAKELSAASSSGKPAPGRLMPQNTAERVPSSDAALLGAGSFIEEIKSIAEDCREDFNPCPQCGYEDHTAIKNSNLLLLIDSALERAVTLTEPQGVPDREAVAAQRVRVFGWFSWSQWGMFRRAVDDVPRNHDL